MAAEVSTSLLRAINGGDSQAGNSTGPITRDFLGAVDGKELDLDLQAPSGWEKRLDLKSGKIYFQRNNSVTSKSPSSTSFQEDFSSPSKHWQQTLNLLDHDSSLDLKLLPTSPSLSSYQSVCTLDKVKSALERAEKARKRSMSSSSTTSSSSVKDTSRDVDIEERSPPPADSFAAAACPGCLMYVLVSPGNPICPRCGCDVPLSFATAAAAPTKRPRIDLNLSV